MIEVVHSIDAAELWQPHTGKGIAVRIYSFRHAAYALLDIRPPKDHAFLRFQVHAPLSSSLSKENRAISWKGLVNELQRHIPRAEAGTIEIGNSYWDDRIQIFCVPSEIEGLLACFGEQIEFWKDLSTIHAMELRSLIDSSDMLSLAASTQAMSRADDLLEIVARFLNGADQKKKTFFRKEFSRRVNFSIKGAQNNFAANVAAYVASTNDPVFYDAAWAHFHHMKPNTSPVRLAREISSQQRGSVSSLLRKYLREVERTHQYLGYVVEPRGRISPNNSLQGRRP